jgi:DNA-binding SARP family transcriptional activator
MLPGVDAYTASLRLCLFGSMLVQVEGQTLTGQLARKELWLLALLALRGDRPVGRDYLAGLLWPDCSQERASLNMRRALSNLRDALGPLGERLQPVKSRSLCLPLQEIFVDVREFDRLTGAGEPALLVQAVELYRAPLLHDCYEEWAHSERLPREFAYQRALETLAAGAMERGDWPEAERLARLRIAADPLQEQGHRVLMEALARGGNHAAATGVYRDLRLRLREEVNADADPETQALFEKIRREAQQIAAAPVKVPTVAPAIEPRIAPAETPTVAPAGQQAAASTVEAMSASPVPERQFRAPSALTPLIGREVELQAVSTHLLRSRLVSLLGPGGVGKTRLSLEIARSTRERYAQGVVFVDLASLSDGNLVAAALAQALEVKEETGRALTTTLCERLKDSQLLVVLDNCEHVVDAAAGVCRTLLAGCASVRVLATSRQPLGLVGELAWRVAPLPTPRLSVRRFGQRAKSDSSTVLEYASVQLFLERALQARPELRIGPRDLESVARICVRLDGIPLALELAASRVAETTDHRA